MSNTAAPPLAMTVNAGSSSLRIGLFTALPDRPDAVMRLRIEPLAGSRPPRGEFAADLPLGDPDRLTLHDVHDHRGALAAVLSWLASTDVLHRVCVVGHRVVHGGERNAPALIDDFLKAELHALSALAPLHQPVALDALDAVAELLPAVAQVACFDTAFHKSIPMAARRYALPQMPSGELLLRHGFHGLSCESAMTALQALAPGLQRVVIAHLGAGVSFTAVRHGTSVDTTMGMTPLEGPPMATRSGTVDPGVLLWLLRHGFEPGALEDLLYRRSGLLGLSGTSGDMRQLLDSADPDAALAVEVFVNQCAKAIASLAVPLGGLEAVVFTGGIGEHSPEVRALIAARCGWLGLHLDDAANRRNARRISSAGSAISAWVIANDEERLIATQALSCLPAGQP